MRTRFAGPWLVMLLIAAGCNDPGEASPDVDVSGVVIDLPPEGATPPAASTGSGQAAPSTVRPAPPPADDGGGPGPTPVETRLVDGSAELGAGTYTVTLTDERVGEQLAIGFSLGEPALAELTVNVAGDPVRLDLTVHGTSAYVGPVAMAWDNANGGWTAPPPDPEAWMLDAEDRELVVLRTIEASNLGEYAVARFGHELAPGAFFEQDGERYDFVALLNFHGDPGADGPVFQWRAIPTREHLTLVAVRGSWVAVAEDAGFPGSAVRLTDVVPLG